VIAQTAAPRSQGAGPAGSLAWLLQPGALDMGLRWQMFKLSMVWHV
jgi:hypothetical protein